VIIIKVIYKSTSTIIKLTLDSLRYIKLVLDSLHPYLQRVNFAIHPFYALNKIVIECKVVYVGEVYLIWALSNLKMVVSSIASVVAIPILPSSQSCFIGPMGVICCHLHRYCLRVVNIVVGDNRCFNLLNNIAVFYSAW